MPLARFRNVARLSLVQPAFLHSACQASSLDCCSFLRLRLAKLAQATLSWDAPLAQQAWSSANMGDVANIASAATAEIVIFIVGPLYAFRGNCSIVFRTV